MELVSSPLDTMDNLVAEPVPLHSPVSVSSTLLSPYHFESTNEKLQLYWLKNPPVNVFLRLMGIILYVPDVSIWLNALQVTYSLFIFSGLAMMIVGGSTMIYYSTIDYYGSLCADEAFVVFGATLILQVVTLVFSLLEMHRRMNSITTRNDVLIMNTSLNSAYFVLILSLVIGLAPAFIGHQSVLFVIGEISICCVLTGVMYFITTDCKVARILLDQLIEQQRLQMLTFEQYLMVRNEIRRRQSSSAWFNNGIVFVALLDILCVLISVFIGMNPSSPHTIFVWSLFMKEVPFLCVVYWQVAQVNEKSLAFLASLAEKRWSVEDGRNQERKDIFVCALGCPITMSLAGMELTRKDLVLQLAAWFVAFLLSVLRSAAVEGISV